MNRLHPALLILVCLGAAPGAGAQDSRAVHVVVPYAPGGAVDLTARLIQPRLSEALGQPVVVDNKPGAAGQVGAEQVSRAPADGTTLLYTVGAELAMRQSRPGATDPSRDLTPIASTVASVSCVVVRASLPVDSLPALIDYAKRNPGKLTYGTAGIASTFHLTGERMKQYGVDMVHVPFKGAGPSVIALVAGEIDVALTNLATALPQIRQGKVRLLAVTQSRRFEGAPEAPAIDEAMPGFDMPVAWYAFFGPPGDRETPRGAGIESEDRRRRDDGGVHRSRAPAGFHPRHRSRLRENHPGKRHEAGVSYFAARAFAWSRSSRALPGSRLLSARKISW
jgi:tripartite-type tricarboxylate transporter receptor subunit TctC